MKDLRDQDLENNDSTIKDGEGYTSGNNSPMKKKNYLPYIILGLVIVTTLVIIFV